MALKDLIHAAGPPTTASSDVRAGHIADHDSQVAAHLKAAGVETATPGSSQSPQGRQPPFPGAWSQNRSAAGVAPIFTQPAIY